jgi:hypothetical protein
MISDSTGIPQRRYGLEAVNQRHRAAQRCVHGLSQLRKCDNVLVKERAGRERDTHLGGGGQTACILPCTRNNMTNWQRQRSDHQYQNQWILRVRTTAMSTRSSSRGRSSSSIGSLDQCELKHKGRHGGGERQTLRLVVVARVRVVQLSQMQSTMRRFRMRKSKTPAVCVCVL